MDRRSVRQGVVVGIVVAIMVAAWLLALPPRGEEPPPWTLPVVDVPATPAYPPLEPLTPRPVRAPPPAPRSDRAEPTTVAAADAPPAPAEPDAPAFVTGTVHGADAADGRTIVVGCGGQGPVDGQGSFYFEVQPGPCEVRAARLEGAFRVRSETVEIAPQPGAEVRVDLTLPSYTSGGVGARVRRHELGIRVQSIVDGSPAQAAGLSAGDVITSVDGAPAVDLTVREFVDLSLGKAGTEVTYTILRDGQEVEVTMTRTPIDNGRG